MKDFFSEAKREERYMRDRFGRSSVTGRVSTGFINADREVNNPAILASCPDGDKRGNGETT